MRYLDNLKNYIYTLSEGGEIEVRSKMRKRQQAAKRLLIRSGGSKQRDMQTIARQFMAAKKRGDTDEVSRLKDQYKKLEDLVEGNDWMQGAVKRPGRCTPMPNPDCPVGSPQYNLGKRFKKAARNKKRKGGTGWQGRV